MTRFIDKTGKTASISLTNLDTHTEWQDEFYEVGGLAQNGEGRYIVEDVDDLLWRGQDFMAGRGEFLGDEPGYENNTLYAEASGYEG